MRTVRFLLFLLVSFTTPALLAAVRGTLMTTEGAPLAGVSVSALRPELPEARITRQLAKGERSPLATAATDSKGAFSLDAGKEPYVEILVRADGYEPLLARASFGDDLGAIPLRAAALKKGSVQSEGKPVGDALVVWYSWAGDLWSVRTDAEGTYAVPDPEVWTSGVRIVHPEFAPLDERRLGSRKPALQWTLSRGIPVNGIVVAEDGKTPVAKAKIEIDGLARGESADDGVFTIAHVSPKWSELRATAADRFGLRTRGGAGGVQVRLQKGASLSGTLREARSQRSLAGATVELRSAAGPLRLALRGQPAVPMTRTDTKGQFSFTAIPPGSYVLGVFLPGYFMEDTEVTVRSGERATKSLLLAQTSVAMGMILDDGKKPVAAARVRVRQIGEGEFNFRMRPSGMSYSAPDGRFVIRSIEPDLKFSIDAGKKGMPNGEAGPYKLSAGETKSGVEIVIPRGILITGSVTDKNGNPLSGVEVEPSESAGPSGMMRVAMRMMRGGAQREDAVKTASDGTFALRLKPGTYDLEFRRESYAPKRLRGEKVTAERDPLSVTLEEGLELRGRLVRKDGSGVPDVLISVVSESVRPDPVQTGGDGSFIVGGLSPGQYMVVAIKPDEFIQENRAVKVPAAQELVIELAAGGTISGRVIDKTTKQPVGDFQAGVSPSRAGGAMVIMRGMSDKRPFHTDDGSFVLESVPTGQVDLTVSAPGYAETRVSGLRVEEGKPLTDIEVALETGVRLAGKVTGPDGSPAAGVTVAVDSQQQAQMRSAGFTVPRMPGEQAATTDADGEYAIDGLEPAEKIFVFRKEGLLTEQKSVKLSGKETRLDVRMSKGRAVSGVVVTDSGAPVADASVVARSPVQNAGRTQARTDSSGAFQMEGLTPGRYTFSASKSGYAGGEVQDVDIEAAGGGIRIALRGGGTIYGRVSGLQESELANASVVARNSEGMKQAPVDSSGNYRIEGTPTGSVSVEAYVSSMVGRRSSAPKTVQLEAGGQTQTDLEFSSDRIIQGRVTKDGKPYTNARLIFQPAGGTARSLASATTDQDGRYEVSGLEDGKYDVRVMEMQRFSSYTTSYTVRGSGLFDIDVTSTGVRGEIADGESGEPIAEATVSLQRSSELGARFDSSAVTDSRGQFSIETVAEGSYRVRAQKDGYGQQVLDVTVGAGGAGELRFKLFKNDGLTLRVVDARDGRSLNGFAVIRNAQGVVWNGPVAPGADGTTRVPLAPGTYEATINVSGYATRILPVSSPSQETKVWMSPGGRLTIVSNSVEKGKLLTPGGTLWREFRLNPGETTFDHVAPGTYTLVVLGEGGSAKKQVPVTIAEGQTARVKI